MPWNLSGMGDVFSRWSHHRLFSSSKTWLRRICFKWVVQPPSQSLLPKINILETGEMHLRWRNIYLLPVVLPPISTDLGSFYIFVYFNCTNVWESGATSTLYQHESMMFSHHEVFHPYPLDVWIQGGPVWCQSHGNKIGRLTGWGWCVTVEMSILWTNWPLIWSILNALGRCIFERYRVSCAPFFFCRVCLIHIFFLWVACVE